MISTLVACGGSNENDTETLINTAPVSNAGSDFSALLGSEVTLDGTKSSDADGDSLTYEWTINSAPVTDIVLNDTAQPAFTPTKEGIYEVALVVNDGKNKSDTDVVIISIENKTELPVAAISNNQIRAIQGENVKLSAEQSKGRNDLAYYWSFLSVPEGSALNSDALQQEVDTNFTPDANGYYIIQLIVNDGESDSSPATIEIPVSENKPPQVNVQIDSLDSTIHQEAHFYSLASDPEGTTINYLWELINTPEGSKQLGLTSEKPTFSYLPDTPGKYTAKLTVSDGYHLIESEGVSLTIQPTEYEYSIGGDKHYFGQVNIPILIDFATSTSPNGNQLDYSWTLKSGPGGSRPTLSKSLINNAETEFTGDKAGTYQILVSMEDNEGLVKTEYIDITLSNKTENNAPHSIVEAPSTVKLGESLILNGSKSFDIDNDLLNYKWQFNQQPPGSNLIFDHPNNVQQLITPVVPGLYSIQLITEDEHGASSNIAVMKLNVYETSSGVRALTKNKIYAKEGEVIILDGSKSLGTDEAEIKWDLINAPYNSSSTIVKANTLTPEFELDAYGKFVFQLRLLKGNDVVSIDHLIVHSMENSLPTAIAGDAITAYSGESLNLSGELSFDNENTPLTFEWFIVGTSNTFTSTPYLDSISISEPTLHIPNSFSGEVVIGLVVSDGKNFSLRDEVIITIKEPEASARLERVSMSSFLPASAPLPYTVNEIIEPMFAEPGDGGQIIAMYYLWAEYEDLTIKNIKFSDKNNIIEPLLLFTDFDFSLPYDEQVQFDITKDVVVSADDFISIVIVSPADTNRKTAQIELSFEILETEDTFKAIFEFTSN